MIVSKRQLVLAILAVLVIGGGAAVYFLTRPQPTDQQQIIALVAQAQRAVERHNATGLTRLLSHDYFDAYGTNRQQMVGMIVSWMRGGEEVRAVPEITSLQINGDFADVKLRVWLQWGSQQPAAGEPYQMQMRLRREGRAWKVISAEGYGEAQSDAMGGD